MLLLFFEKGVLTVHGVEIPDSPPRKISCLLSSAAAFVRFFSLRIIFYFCLVACFRPPVTYLPTYLPHLKADPEGKVLGFSLLYEGPGQRSLF